MSPLTRFLRNAATAAFAVVLLALSAPDAHATHFRYGTISWRVQEASATQTKVIVSAECAWRRSFYTPQPNVGSLNFNTGQQLQLVGTGFSTGTPLVIDVTSVNPTEDWFVGNKTFEFLVPKTAFTPGPLRIFWNGAARISTLMDGNADDSFNVEARSTNITNEFSPVASLLPIVNVAHGQPAAHFFIPAVDPLGSPLNWSIASTVRSLLTKAAPDGWPDPGPQPTLSINPTTGEVTWNTAAELAPVAGQELYAVQFLVSDNEGGEIPVDALLRLVPNTSQPPVALIDNSPNPAVFQVNPGQHLSFVFKGTDPDVNDTVTLNSGGGMPVGATFTPQLPVAGLQPQSAVFDWTPTLANVGSHVISLSVTDNFALQDTTSATITVLPNFQPIVGCPVSVTLEATGPTTPYTALTTVDDPEDQQLTVTFLVDGTQQQVVTVPPTTGVTTVPFSFGYALGPHPLHVDVSDGITPTVSCNATVTIVDTTGPVIDLPPNQILEATSPAGAVATWSPDPPHATDPGFGPVPVTCNHNSGETFPILPPPPQDTTTTVSCSATDTHGNTTNGNFQIIVRDTTPPAVTVPSTITVEATGPGGATATFTTSALDIVDGSITPTCDHASGSQFPLGPTTVTCTATDVHNNTGSNSFVVNVVDTTPPVVTVPLPMTLEATGPGGANASFTATAVDIVDGNITPTCVPPSGSLFPLGTTTVTCSATDAHNNTGSASFTITVVDTTPPVVTVPGNMVVEATGPGGANASFTATAVDIVDGNITPTCVPASGSLFPLLPPPPPTTTTTVVCTATDAHNNSGSASFTVTVQDTTPPVISNVPANITVPTSLPGGGAVVTYTNPTAFDIVDQVVAVNCVPPSGSTFPIGTTTVNCSASDVRGNTSTASFTVTVTPDNTPPEPCVTLGPSILWPPDHKMMHVDVNIAVEPGASCQITGVTSSEPVTGHTYGTFAPDWTFNNLNLELRVERYDKPGRTYSVTVACTDANGNVGTAVAKAIVPHDMGHDIPPPPPSCTSLKKK